uniref:Transmembrane protein n=1 Tax=Anguilla anguilla TaxID=7936 RepID=A0A0E9XGK9_ANGAN
MCHVDCLNLNLKTQQLVPKMTMLNLCIVKEIIHLWCGCCFFALGGVLGVVIFVY